MNKRFKLIEVASGKETICEKIAIDGDDYYLAVRRVVKGDTTISGNVALEFGWNWSFRKIKTDAMAEHENTMAERMAELTNPVPTMIFKAVVATTNYRKGLPQVLSELPQTHRPEYVIAHEYEEKNFAGDLDKHLIGIFLDGYNECKKTHPLTTKEICEYASWLRAEDVVENAETYANFSDEDMLNHWISLQPEKVYYENR